MAFKYKIIRIVLSTVAVGFPLSIWLSRALLKKVPPPDFGPFWYHDYARPGLDPYMYSYGKKEIEIRDL